MTTVSINFPDDVYGVLRTSPKEFAKELQIAAAAHWYSLGRVSQAKGAEIAGLSRSEFIDELFHRHIPAIQTSAEDAIEEATGA